ncbi:MAG TPA: HIT domain-containing protein [Candidatus Cybelea sp.]|jgi:histidine triad (HIT) family protein|nr:HIT domain-containing protein [Candidatus Cybelea sp.]
MSDSCIFCRIASGEIPATAVHRDDDVIVIEDIDPKAPSHLLVMPVSHHATLAELAEADPALAGRLLALAARLGRERGGAGGYRIVVNTGRDGGQTVDHVHVHVLAGRAMTWPPG